MEKGLLHKILFRSTSIAPLITFRVLFGGLMMVGALRFMQQGWVERLYVAPTFFFKFYGFEWVSVLSPTGMYLLYSLIALSAACIMLGFFYRLATILFFLSFTYSELIDSTNYLNHYYLVCLLGFLLIFIPAHRSHSLDVWRKPQWKRSLVPVWTINSIILQVSLVYCFAGIAKLNSDWLLRAMPLAIWLPTKADWPLLGQLFAQSWTAYAFSWTGALYDLTIPFFLLHPRTRPFAYIAVIVFHVLTKLLFNIGLFPFIMIFNTLIFFSGAWHRRVWSGVGNLKSEVETQEVEKPNRALISPSGDKGAWSGTLGWSKVRNQKNPPRADLSFRGTRGVAWAKVESQEVEKPSRVLISPLGDKGAWDQQRSKTQSPKSENHTTCNPQAAIQKNTTSQFTTDKSTTYNQITNTPINPQPTTRNALLPLTLSLFFLLQLLLPFRYLGYPGHLLWTEQGYRFSWRVMLVEKVGQATFYVEDSASGRSSEVNNADYLTTFQEKQMSIQPDMILQFAHFLAQEYEIKHGLTAPKVRVDSHVALNGRRSQRFIDPSVNLATIKDSWAPKTWIIPFKHE